MPDFSKASIYKIVCNITGKIYIGSTCQPLHKRLYEHVKYFKSGIYMSSSEIITNGNYNIILIEEYICDNRQELLKQERHYIDTLDCVNKRCPIRTHNEVKEYRKEYKKVRNEKDKKWYETNKEKCREYKQKNKETITLKEKEYKTQKVSCSICSQEMNRGSLYRHKQSKHKVDFTCIE